MEEQDLDDLDLLACLVDSDSEFDDDIVGEAISSSNTSQQSTTKVPVTQSQSQLADREDGVQSGTATNITMEEMAARMATMEEYIKKLEAERKLLSPPKPVMDARMSHSPKEGKEVQQSKLSEQVCKNDGENLDTSCQTLFSKDNKRKAHTPTHCANTPVSTESRTSSRNPGIKEKADKSKSKVNNQELKCTWTAKTVQSQVPRGLNPTYGNMKPLNKKTVPEPETRASKADDDENFSKDRFSSLRIINPLISSVVMEKRMEGRRMVMISQIPTKIKGNNDIDGDWVTIGVIVQKLPPKKSSNGNTYGIWKLSDLGANTANECVVLFLFGDVYKEHWKTTEGSVVALLNASLLPAKEKYSKDLALTLDNPKKLMLMGVSKDLGKCKGVRKSDNRPCSNFVNRQHGEFCEYHVQAAYKSMRAQRMECQAGYGPSDKAPLMKKFKKDLNSSTFMYQGRSVNASNRPTDQKKKNVTLKSLNIGDKNAAGVVSKADSSGKQENKSNTNTETSDFLVQLLALPTVGTRNLVRHLNQDEEQKKPEEERKPIMSASELLKAHEKDIKRNRSRSANTSAPPAQNDAPDTPMLGRGLAPGSDLFFDESPNIKKRKSNDVERAKLRALSAVRQKGPIEKEDPNAVRKKLSPKAKEQIMKMTEDSGKENDDDNADQDCRKKRRRILGPEFGSIDLNSDEGKKLLAAKSQHVGAVRAAEAEMQEKYFNELEKKEQLEDKMKTITEIKVKVVSCKQCNYVAESASELCRKENHSLKYSKTLKKFFMCKGCKQRTVTYGAPIPKHPCRQCGASNYEKTSMYKEELGGCSSSPCQNGGKCISTCHLVPFSFRCECEKYYFGDMCQYWTGDFDLSFKTKSTSNYANTTILNHGLTALTFCIWFQTTQSGSFGLVAGDIDLTCEDNGQCTFFIKTAKRTFYSAPLNDGAWHSVCVTWLKSIRICTAYVDGKTNAKRSFDSCRGNNDLYFNGTTLVLGQKIPNDEDGLFLASHSFVGNLSRLNIWDYAMDDEQVYGVASDCSKTSGNVLSWEMFQIDLQGSVVKTERSCCSGADLSSKVAVEFPALTEVDHIQYSGTLPSLQAFTICHWIKIVFMGSLSSTVSYANDEAHNALLIAMRKTRALSIYVNGAEVGLKASPVLDKHWHHVCITWTNIEGKLNFYIDGALKRAKTEFKKGAVIKGGGVVVIGQDQDSLGGSFHVLQSFAGLLSHVNVWNFVLRTFALVDMATGFGTEAGNTIAWKDLVRSQAYGQAKVVTIFKDPPMRPKSDFKFVFPTQSTENFVQLQNATSDLDMDKFMACVWVKVSVETNISFFCYRTPEHRNSIAIRLKPDNFHVLINGVFLPIDFTSFTFTFEWQHICFTWENSAGNWKLYINGELVKSGTGFESGEVIKGGGKVVLGQRYSQAADFDGFKSGQSFIGEISHLNIWNTTLDSSVVSSMFRGCDFIGGNWFNWAAFLEGEVAGDVTLKTPADCTLPDEISSNKRNKVCETETKDGCVSPVRALFDGKPSRRTKRWRCYFIDALTEDAFGLDAYDNDKSSACYKNLNSLLRTIE